ncbi:hypothetical protein P7K49_007486 [Saguinus oedipus]|uniref:Uncharacterized protein n=1 Tax=Saguinus oedipus TaxID=9490 RepID=A0ABQ9VVQ2_SAGOE|nr:hypothetical protein P7K49_007486 [Saguinus oedipus]
MNFLAHQNSPLVLPVELRIWGALASLQKRKPSSMGINKTCSAPRGRLGTLGRPDAAFEELPSGRGTHPDPSLQPGRRPRAPDAA